MIWFVFFTAVTIHGGDEYIGVRSNMPFESETACVQWISDVENEANEYAHVAAQIPEARISFACASAAELGVLLGEQDT